MLYDPLLDDPDGFKARFLGFAVFVGKWLLIGCALRIGWGLIA